MEEILWIIPISLVAIGVIVVAIVIEKLDTKKSMYEREYDYKMKKLLILNKDENQEVEFDNKKENKEHFKSQEQDDDTKEDNNQRKDEDDEKDLFT